MEPRTTSALLYLNGVTVSFDGFRALDNLSLAIEPGEMRAIIGPNGAGKTTMMDVVTGKTRPDGGEVYFDGTFDLTSLDETEIAELGVGRKFQKPTVFDSHSVENNLRLALKGDRRARKALSWRESEDERQRIDRLLETTQLGAVRDTIAGGLAHGQKQWLEIGMLLAQDPKLLLVDETIDLHYGAAQALRAVSLQAEHGKVTCVLGRNGVGKTSLLRALVGQHPVSRGSIRWEGADITRLKPDERARRGIAYVPQGREIFPLLTVEENLETGFAPLKRDERRIPDDVFALFPVLREMLRRRGGDLSGGQQQQLAIGRAMVMQPRLLLLDEPTEGIQPSIIKDIGRAIAYLRNLGRIAIVLVEQYLDFARELGDHFAVMDRGAVKYACDRSNLDPAEISRQMAL